MSISNKLQIVYGFLCKIYWNHSHPRKYFLHTSGVGWAPETKLSQNVPGKVPRNVPGIGKAPEKI